MSSSYNSIRINRFRTITHDPFKPKTRPDSGTQLLDFHLTSQSLVRRMSKPSTPQPNTSNSNASLILRRELNRLAKQPVEGFSAGKVTGLGRLRFPTAS